MAETTRNVYGVRWTDHTGATAVHRAIDDDAAADVVDAIRRIQSQRGSVPDAHLVTREMDGNRSVGEWVAASPRRARTEATR